MSHLMVLLQMSREQVLPVAKLIRRKIIISYVIVLIEGIFRENERATEIFSLRSNTSYVGRKRKYCSNRL